MSDYIRLFFGVLLLFAGYKFISNHYNDDLKLAEKERIRSFEKLVKEPAKATASLDSVYKEVTVKIMGLPMKSYEFKYFFAVDERTYTGACSFDKVPSLPFIQISYLADDPEINSHDATGALKALKDSQESNFILYVGLAFGIMGIFRTISSWMEIKAKKKAREEEEERQLEEDNRRIFGNG